MNRISSLCYRAVLLLAVSVPLITSGCAGTFSHTLSYDPAQPLRVAVLPFVMVDRDGAIIAVEDGTLALDSVPGLSAELSDTPPELLRKAVQRELRNTQLDPLAPYLVNVELPHHGFAFDDGTVDLKKLYTVPTSQICTHFLDCDAALYGRVTAWDRAYYGIQSVNTVGLRLTLVDAKTNRVLFESEAEDSESRGLTKGPTGYSSLVLEPIRGLDSEIISDLSDRLVLEMLKPLSNMGQQAEDKTPPPSIFAASFDGSSARLQRGEPLTVLAFADPGLQAWFALGNSIQHVPMSERRAGHYYGEFVPLSFDAFSNEYVTVFVKDARGRVTSQRLPGERLTLTARE
ncbi:MAG: DUF799 family lipoprotein [Bdellovibrionales bacterium]|nr:DUF799 family lipoprotein [Bdellovibrionales bacterium]